jgi:hypothetical protein
LETLPGSDAGFGVALEGKLRVYIGKIISRRLRWALKTPEGL